MDKKEEIETEISSLIEDFGVWLSNCNSKDRVVGLINGVNSKSSKISRLLNKRWLKLSEENVETNIKNCTLEELTLIYRETHKDSPASVRYLDRMFDLTTLEIKSGLVKNNDLADMTSLKIKMQIKGFPHTSSIVNQHILWLYEKDLDHNLKHLKDVKKVMELYDSAPTEELRDSYHDLLKRLVKPKVRAEAKTFHDLKSISLAHVNALDPITKKYYRKRKYLILFRLAHRAFKTCQKAETAKYWYKQLKLLNQCSHIKSKKLASKFKQLWIKLDNDEFRTNLKNCQTVEKAESLFYNTANENLTLKNHYQQLILRLTEAEASECKTDTEIISLLFKLKSNEARSVCSNYLIKFIQKNHSSFTKYYEIELLIDRINLLRPLDSFKKIKKFYRAFGVKLANSEIISNVLNCHEVTDAEFLYKLAPKGSLARLVYKLLWLKKFLKKHNIKT